MADRPQRPNKKPKAGWFVEVDPALKEEFKAYYPTRAAMNKVTIAAIKNAIRWAKDHNLPRVNDEI